METPYKDKFGKVICVGDHVLVESHHGEASYIVNFGEYDGGEAHQDTTHCGYYVELINDGPTTFRHRYTLPDVSERCEVLVKVTSTKV